MTRAVRSGLLLALKLALAAGIIAWLVAAGKLRAESFQTVLAHGWRLAACAALLSAIPLLGALRWRLLLACLGFRLPYGRVLHLGLVGLLFNCFGIGYVGGDVVKAYYAAVDQPRGRRAEAVTSVACDRFVGLIGLLALAILAMACRPAAVWGSAAAPQLRVAAIALVAIFAGLVAVFLLTFSRRVRESPALAGLLSRLPGGPTLLRIYRAVAVYRTRPGPVFAALGISLVGHSLNLIVYWQLAQTLGFPPIGVVEFAFYLALGLAASSFGLPMGIGVGQVVFGYLFSLSWGEGGYELGAALATLQQGVSLVFNLAAGLPAFLLVRGDRARVKAEMAEDQSAAAAAAPAGKPADA